MSTEGMLSVIIITLNEEEMISHCIESVLIAAQRAVDARLVISAEVLLVDSRSTDRTVEIASCYPITVWQLRPAWPRSAGAGIYTGFHQSLGEFIALVDGDLTIDPDWLTHAMRYLHDDPLLGGLYGAYREAFVNETPLTQQLSAGAVQHNGDTPREVECIGNAIFRREAIEAAGGHHPYLKGGEDRELSLRVHAAGYRLLLVPEMMGIHHWAKQGRMTMVDYLRSVWVWSYGEGMAARAALDASEHEQYASYTQRYCHRDLLGPLRWLIAPTAMLVGLLVMALSAPIVLREAGLGLTVGGLLLALRSWSASKRSFRDYLFLSHRIPYGIIRLLGFRRGRATPVPPRASYPTDPILLQRADQLLGNARARGTDEQTDANDCPLAHSARPGCNRPLWKEYAER